jgi:allantoinase
MPGRDHPFDLLIRNGIVVTSVGALNADLGVHDGKIAGFVARDARPPHREAVDARGLHVLPGIIDTHVHTRDPGVVEREDFWSGTCAAAAGGITTLFEMPIAKRPVNSARTLKERAALIQPRALIDFGLYGGAGQENIDAIAEQASAGAVAFKTFLLPPPPARLDEFVGLWCTSPSALRDVMAATSQTGIPHAFHAEHAGMIETLEAGLRAAGRVDALAHAESRPSIVEEAAVAMVLAGAREHGGHVHFVHVSSWRSADLIARARAQGISVTAETCPQYLCLTTDALAKHGGFAKCNPALRSAIDVERLWPFVIDGTVDVLGSDHSPFLDAEKERGSENIFLAPPGLTGLELMLPLMLTSVAAQRLTLGRMVRLMSERAAELFRLAGKGRVAPGCDADLTLVDLSARWQFDRRRSFSHTPGGMRAYDGLELQGRVVSTFVRGERVFHEGEITGRQGHGRFVRPERSPRAGNQS